MTRLGDPRPTTAEHARQLARHLRNTASTVKTIAEMIEMNKRAQRLEKLARSLDLMKREGLIK